LQLAEDFSVFRESIGVVFAVNHSAVDCYIEDAARALDEFGFDANRFFNCCCQTGSLWCVVSHHAVGD
jgi:hypothetical protein